MKVCVRPTLIDERPLAVVNPRTNRPFPQGKVFDLSPDDARHAGVRRLLPKTVAGGRTGDLIPEADLTSQQKAALKAVAALLAPPAEPSPPAKKSETDSKEA